MDREAPMRAETKQMAKLFMVFIQESPSDDCTVRGFGKSAENSVYPDSRCSSRATLLTPQERTLPAVFPWSRLECRLGDYRGGRRWASYWGNSPYGRLFGHYFLVE